jgi:3-isopropylmalate dehydrogenase
MPVKIAVLAGDGIGPEVTAQAVRVLQAVRSDLDFEEALVGGAAYDDGGHPLPPSTLDLCKRADAVLLGAVGGPKWDKVEPISLRPEVGALLPLRAELNLFANLRPAKTFRPLLEASPLKGEEGLIDLMVVRELTGGIYFGKPRERRENGTLAVDTCLYSRAEVERIARVGFEVARQRGKRVVSVDKANVLETSRLWRETVTETAPSFPDVELSHMLVDNCAMQLVRSPRQFDVILTENMFGDILSDEASMVTGSLGLLPSASLSSSGSDGEAGAYGLYEPIHGSAPDIAGQGIANPIAAILSGAMLLKYTLGDDAGAARIERAVESVLAKGLRTRDLHPAGQAASTRDMGDEVLGALEAV